MATRIHVTAVRNCDVQELRSVFTGILGPAFEGLPINEVNGWAWFSTSVWAVGADALNRGLCKVARPGLQFTTSDGDRWYLTIHGGNQGQVNFLHEFRYHRRPATLDEDAYYKAELEQHVEPDID